MTESQPPGTPQEQLVKAVADLFSLLEESGDDYVIFMDRRRLSTKIQFVSQRKVYRVSWELEDESWSDAGLEFENPREAAFHAYQGPH